MDIGTNPALTCQRSSAQIVCSDGLQWAQLAGSPTAARGFSGTSIGSRGLRVTASKDDSSSSTNASADSRAPIGRVRW
jgi:hypothetical protein